MSTSDVLVLTNSGIATTTANQSMSLHCHAQPTAIPDAAPPPYAEAGHASATEDDDEPVTLVVNAASAIKGDGNVVQPMQVVDAAKLSAMLMVNIKQLVHQDPRTAHAPRPKINLTINCGITVIGDRNVIGNITIKPQGSPPGAATRGTPAAPVTSSVAGTKRAAQDEGSGAAPKPKAQKVSAATK